MPEHNSNLWAPWRGEYIRALCDFGQDAACFLCGYAAHPDDDQANGVVLRGAACLLVMNRYPYTNGHLLVAPLAHLAGVEDLGDDVLLEMGRLTRLAVGILAEVVRADGYNLGTNLGRCAGAGLPGHIHSHIVPRWNGDTNFMTTVGNARLIPEDLQELCARLRQCARARV